MLTQHVFLGGVILASFGKGTLDIVGIQLKGLLVIEEYLQCRGHWPKNIALLIQSMRMVHLG